VAKGADKKKSCVWGQGGNKPGNGLYNRKKKEELEIKALAKERGPVKQGTNAGGRRGGYFEAFPGKEEKSQSGENWRGKSNVCGWTRKERRPGELLEREKTPMNGGALGCGGGGGGWLTPLEPVAGFGGEALKRGRVRKE